MIVVFSGYNQRAVIAFLRTLEQNKIESFCIIASGESDLILKTVYQKKVVYIRKLAQLDLDEIIFALKLVINISIKVPLFIAPSTEALNRFFLQYRDIFERMNCIIPLVEKNIYEWVSDKSKFYQLCKENGICVPRKCLEADGFMKPLVAKPKEYYSSNGMNYSPTFLLSNQEYNNFWKSHSREDFDVQEFLVGGISVYLLFYFSHTGEIFCCSQKNLIQQKNGKSIVAACYSDYHNKEDIVEPYIILFKKIEFYGLVMVELRHLNGNYYMIEANPRFWGPSQLFCDIGYNFFEFMLKDYDLIKQISNLQINKKAVYFWSGGIHQKLFEDDDCVWHDKAIEVIKNREADFFAADIYKKEDTMNIYNIELLEKLYMQTSKHSNYQILPSSLKKILNEDNLAIKTRQERERFTYIKKHIDFRNKTILDIGGNTGFFTFEMLEEGAKHVDYYEGNLAHAEFVRTASIVLDVSNKLTVYPEYYMFNTKEKKYDIILCLNVVHHLGDDFKSENLKEEARKKMITSINSLSLCTDILVFQMGFNWKGDPKEGLFDNGTKEEMEQFLIESIKDDWYINFIGIAEKNNNIIKYQEKNKDNNQRQDNLGEFLNRPIFIMKSKRSKI